jgi:hypothetical protein
MTVMEWIRRVSSTKYTRLLEADVARLRAENRALLNSILGIAGVPPVVVADNDVSPAAGLKPSVSSAAAITNGVRVTVPMKNGAPRNRMASAIDQKATPMRRRSWPQIYRMLEINSTQKKEAGEII